MSDEVAIPYYLETKYYLEYTIFGGHSSDGHERIELEVNADDAAPAAAINRWQRRGSMCYKPRLIKVQVFKGIKW